MTPQTDVNWLLIGAGDIARKRVAPALNAAEGSRLAAVCDVDERRAKAFADEFDVNRVHTDPAQALADSAVNAVYLATPIALHAAQAVQALDAGKHVLVEKPLGLTADDAQQAVDAAARHDLRAGCAYFRRFAPRYDATRQMLANREFGRVVLIRMTYFSWFNPAPDDPKHWRVVRSQSGGGPISDMGSHMFDVLIGLLGMPARVYAQCDNLVHAWDVEDSAAIVMTMPDGARVVATFNWNSKTWSHEFEIIGTDAKIKWHPCDAGPVIKTVGRDIAELDLPNPGNVHQPLIDDFVAAVRQQRDPAIPLAEAQKTNRLIDAVYRSAQTGTEVTL